MSFRLRCTICGRKAIDNEFFAKGHWILKGHYPENPDFQYPTTSERLKQHGKRGKSLEEDEVEDAEEQKDISASSEDVAYVTKVTDDDTPEKK